MKQILAAIIIIISLIAYSYLLTWYVNEVIILMSDNAPWQDKFWIVIGWFGLCLIIPAIGITIVKKINNGKQYDL